MGERLGTRKEFLPRACLVAAVALLALFVAVPMAGATVAVRNVAATTGSDQYDPDIDGSRVVYTSNAAGNNDIYLYNLTTKARKRLTTSAADQSKPEISGDNIVFLDSSSGTAQAVCYTISTGQTRALTTGAAKVYEVAISGNTVVYVVQSATPNSYDVISLGLASGPAVKLGTYPMSQPYGIDVAGSYVAYSARPYNEDDDSGRMNLYYGPTSGPVKVIGEGDSAAVGVDGTVVYSRSYGDYDPLLMKYSPATQAVTVLFEGWAEPLGISNGRVLLCDSQSLSVYNLAAGTRMKIAVPKNLSYMLRGGISGKWVVWDAARKRSSNGYVWQPNTPGHLMDYDVKAGKFSGTMLKLSCSGVSYGKRAVVKGRATTITGGSYKGRVTLQRSYDAKHWVTLKTKSTSSSGSFSITSGVVKKPVYFRVKFRRGSARATSYFIKVTPHAIVSAPDMATEIVAGQPVSMEATARPALSGMGASFRFERKAPDGTWVYPAPYYASPTVTAHTGYFSYAATVTFTQPGEYRAWLVAGYPEKGLAYGSSTYTYFTVK